MRTYRTATAFLAVTLGIAGAAQAHHRDVEPDVAPGRLVTAQIRVGGTSTPLYSAVDGSGRYYFEARAGSSYELVFNNQTGERLGVGVSVDGLNVISGEPDSLQSPGRMYILGPWESTTIRGWRTSLQDVRRFTFVDERRSYAARSGHSTSKLGWVEVAVYRERMPVGRIKDLSEDNSRRERDAAKGAPAAGAQAASRAEEREARNDGSYPGTGWGSSTEDHARVVAFDPMPVAADRITLRYEYRSGLVALGVLPEWRYGRDRLRDRDSGRGGFARPPRW